MIEREDLPKGIEDVVINETHWMFNVIARITLDYNILLLAHMKKELTGWLEIGDIFFEWEEDVNTKTRMIEVKEYIENYLKRMTPEQEKEMIDITLSRIYSILGKSEENVS